MKEMGMKVLDAFSLGVIAVFFSYVVIHPARPQQVIVVVHDD